LLTLTKAQVLKYKSIEDSSPVDITDDVTVLVGKNESGKTAFLEALHKALPLGNAKFDFVFDYPRKDYVKYRPLHEAKSYANVVELTFRIEKNVAARINTEVFHGAEIIQPGQTFTRTANYGNGASLGFSLNEKAAIEIFKNKVRRD
jgi:predicted ATP-dependent endonuclease of OLD family